MNSKFVVALTLGALTAACGIESDEMATEFDYFQNGADWGEVADLCASGTEQSPIDLSKSTMNKYLKARMGEYENYSDSDGKYVERKAHTIEMPFEDGELKLRFADGMIAEASPLQLHFHAPSEHTIDGKNMDLELHIVHQFSDGSLGAVIGIFFDRYAGGNYHNKLIDALEFDNATDEEGGNPVGDVNLKDFLRDIDMSKFWSYDGSLTTPPCTEGIKWTVFSEI